MKTIYKITFFCGYPGTKETDFVKADCLADAEKYAKEGLPDYISDWEHLVNWSPEDMDEEEYEGCEEEYEEVCFYDSQEYEDYVADCGYEIAEATEDDFENWGINPEEIQEI